MIGADYLIAHGMSFSHLDLRNSYGQMINAYYNSNYPSGADTLFGASAKLLALTLIWALQPFTAAMLATATGPAWLLARRMGLDGFLAALAALSVTLPALVYGYGLSASDQGDNGPGDDPVAGRALRHAPPLAARRATGGDPVRAAARRRHLEPRRGVRGVGAHRAARARCRGCGRAALARS